jgi:hypothetical protein
MSLPALFNSTVTKNLLRYASEGNPPNECARLSGISPVMLRTWLDRGADESSIDYEEYASFAQEFHKKSNRLTSLALRAIEDAMEEGDAQVALKFVQMHPSTADEFSPTRRSQTNVNVQIEGGGVRASIDQSLRELLALHAGPAIIDVEEVADEEETS